MNYTIEIDPGPIYRMGSVHFDGAPDAMAARLAHLWKMAPGEAFDESYVVEFRGPRTKTGPRPLPNGCKPSSSRFDVKPDPATHQVNCVFHFAKAAQGGR